MQIVDVTKEDECCCSCKHNIRKPEKDFIVCHCDIDSHYISYVANFASVCERWEASDWCCCDCKHYQVEENPDNGERLMECLKYQCLVDGLDDACDEFEEK